MPLELHVCFDLFRGLLLAFGLFVGVGWVELRCRMIACGLLIVELFSCISRCISLYESEIMYISTVFECTTEFGHS